MINWIYAGYGVYEDFYYHPDAVLVALFLLVFVVIFSTFQKMKFLGRDSKGINIAISLIISLFFMYYSIGLYAWLKVYNSILVITVLAAVGIFFLIFLKFIRKQF